MSKYTHIIFILLSISANIIFAQAFDWAKRAGGSSNDKASSIAVDDSGNCYITGTFGGTAIFENEQITSFGEEDIFIAKYNVEGEFQWVQQAGGPSEDMGNGIAADDSGNVYVTGNFQNTAIFGNVQIPSQGLKDIFIAKYNKNGNLKWIRSAGGLASGKSIAIDTMGNVYVTGDFHASLHFDSTHIVVGDIDIFLAKYDNAGTVCWVQTAGGNSYQYSNAIAVDHWGNSFITGHFLSGISFGQITLYGDMRNNSAFFAKYDVNGNIEWAYEDTPSFGISPTGVALDEFNDCYFIGSITPVYGYIRKYDNSGNHQWLKYAVGDGIHVTGISIDNLENVWITGFLSYGYGATFDTIYVTSDDGKGFIAKLSQEPGTKFKSVKQFNGTSAGIATDESGNNYVTGSFTNTASFGSVLLTSAGADDIYIAKLSEPQLNITAPDGGEVWESGTFHNITWHGILDGDITIELTTDNGISWINLTPEGYPYNNYSYNFNVPFSPSSSCKIRALSQNFEGVTDESDNIFTITNSTAPIITVTYPNGEEAFKLGTNDVIKWNSSDDINNLNIEFSNDNGEKWEELPAGISASAGSYEWQVPDLYSKDCRIRVVDAENPTVYDISDLSFSIVNLELISPNDGVVWQAGTQHDISWISNEIPSIKIEFTSDNGSVWHIIAIPNSIQNNKYNWRIPQTTSSNCRVRLSHWNHPNIQDYSESTFRIFQLVSSTYNFPIGIHSRPFDPTNISIDLNVFIAGSVDVTFFEVAPVTGNLPDGAIVSSKYYWQVSGSGIVFTEGSISVPISTLWGVENASSLVWLKRELSGDNWTNIGGTISGEILMSTIPFNSFSEFAIGSTTSDNSLEFEIPLELNLTSPNGGEIWFSHSEQKIKWGSNGINTINIEYTSDDGGIWHPIETISTIGNEYTWTVPNINSFNCRIRISDLDNSDVWDVSENTFGIFDSSAIIFSYELFQNYPNPFNNSTIIRFSIPQEGVVTLKVYDILGREISTLLKEIRPTGNSEFEFNARGLSSGVYFYRLQSADYDEVKKMLLIK